MKKLFVMAPLFALLVALGAVASEVKLEGVKCLIAGRPIAADKAADYKGAKVYFCCGNCLGKFNKVAKPFAAKANRQLVETSQAKQKACPLSGAPCNVSVEDGVKIGFCCNNCLGKYNDATAEERLNFVFSDAAFAKGFEVNKAREEFLVEAGQPGHPR